MSETDPRPEVAAPAAASAEPDGATAGRTSARADRRRRPSLTALFALALAVVATTIAGSLWWQYREFYVALDDADADTGRALEGVRGSVVRIDERIDALAAALEAGRTRMDTVGARLDTLPARLAGIEQNVAALQGGSLEARADWLRAEAEYHLALANTELALAGRWENAIAALERADRALLELGDPAFGPVREAIADELLALRAVSLPDIEGLAFSLARLEARLETFPLRGARRVAGTDSGDPLADAEPGFGRLWLGLKQALASIVRVERTDTTVAPLLSTEEQALVRRLAMLELKLARAAALGGEAQAFRAALGAAADLLRSEFDATAAEVESAVALLEQMRALEIAPPKPDISGSLARLRTTPAGGN